MVEKDAMKDEYGTMDASGEAYFCPFLKLDCGETLENVEVRYKTFGVLNDSKTNAMVVCHALTGNAALDTWWGDMVGEGLLFDTSKYFVICSNILGSCYGTCGPRTVNPKTGKEYGTDFPDVTVRDAVRLQISLVKNGLGIRQVACVVGGSLGGMQTLEWGAMEGNSGFVKSLIVMCCGAYHHAWQIAISETQRQAIYADPNWKGGAYDPVHGKPKNGISVARQIAMFSYRSHEAYAEKFGRQRVEGKKSVAGNGQRDFYEVERYLRHQGQKFISRFDALSYVKLTRMMDTHDLGRGRGGAEKALSDMKIPVFIISVDSDALYPPTEQKFLHKYIQGSEFHLIESMNGHDGFLLDQHLILPKALKFLSKHALTAGKL